MDQATAHTSSCDMENGALRNVAEFLTRPKLPLFGLVTEAVDTHTVQFWAGWPRCRGRFSLFLASSKSLLVWNQVRHREWHLQSHRRFFEVSNPGARVESRPRGRLIFVGHSRRSSARRMRHFYRRKWSCLSLFLFASGSRLMDSSLLDGRAGLKATAPYVVARRAMGLEVAPIHILIYREKNGSGKS